MSAIFGHCPFCPAGGREVRLYGGVCAYHFSVKPGKPKPKKTEIKKLSQAKKSKK